MQEVRCPGAARPAALGQDHDAMNDAKFFFGSNDGGQGNLTGRAGGVSDASAHIARLVRQAMMADWREEAIAAASAGAADGLQDSATVLDVADELIENAPAVSGAAEFSEGGSIPDRQELHSESPSITVDEADWVDRNAVPGAMDGGVLEEPEAPVPDVARLEGVDQELQAAENSLPDEVKEWLLLVSAGVRVLEERYGSLDVDWVLRGSGSASPVFRPVRPEEGEPVLGGGQS